MAPAHKPNDSLTESQQKAVHARENVLVMAGAGTGKTKTLVDRCLDCLENDGAQIDELLIVTFTEAAAAELRERLRKKLEARTDVQPRNERWPEQLARFDLAHIGTLHGFCLKLVREHFYELGLDPRLAILDEGEARQLASETLNEQFTAHYEGKESFSPAVQELIQIHGGGRDEKIRQLILRLHHYSQTRPNAAEWLQQHREKFSAAEPSDWQSWLAVAIADWRDEWLPVLENLKSENEKAAELAVILSRLSKKFSRADAFEMLGQMTSADGNWPAKRKTVLRKPLADFFDDAIFLSSLASIKNGTDPLAEDWGWVRGQMETLLRLAEEFAGKFAAAKLAAGGLDFHDLEQFALKLLWNFSEKQPTAIAKNWRAKLKFVFVDEYQDINSAQDKIIAALSRDGADANRFLVGDVKQSIYRFRLADPQIFRDYAHNWRGDAGQTIPLATNFRSREGLLNFVNSVFRRIMRPEIGGVKYGEDAELKFGLSEKFSVSADRSPRAELLVRFKNGRNESREDEGGELADLNDAQREARLVAWRLKQLLAERHEIFDDEKKVFRPVEWRDMAILLRSPRGKSEIFAQEFERAGIPLAVARGGFYESAEILDLLSLLQLLDNPLQDVPCIAVLRSPLVGLSLDELAEIRLAAKEKHFWTALNRSQKSEIGSQKFKEKIAAFLERFSRWRMLAKLVSLSQCLEEILSETLYADWLRAQPRGAQRAANVASFLQLAQKFDQFQRQGLFRFLKFIEAGQAAEAEPEVSAGAAENAVRLMSIHQSKGLEFPLVVLADLAKNFNEQDLRGEIIFDEQFGLCPKIKPPSSGRRYPSLSHWLAQRRQKRELRGEELRLLYVALTRARDNLILTASVTEKNWNEKWTQPQPATARAIAGANSFTDWLAIWFSVQSPKSKVQSGAGGELENLRWQMVSDEELAARWGETPGEPQPVPVKDGSRGRSPHPLDEAMLQKLCTRLKQDYPFTDATKRKAKSSVTALRRAAEELDDEAESLVPRQTKRGKQKTESEKKKLSAAETGLAHHKFLQHFALKKTDFVAEANRLVRENYLSAAERAVLDLAALELFWRLELGKKISAQASNVKRELPFTARFRPAEISKITGTEVEAGLENEFVVVQGVADLVVILPAEIWLVDFKTDAAGGDELAEKIKIYTPQLRLYAAALGKIFARPVTVRALHFLAARRTVEV
jgi:ATP-dependent helicase/nuclease subunit A